MGMDGLVRVTNESDGSVLEFGASITANELVRESAEPAAFPGAVEVTLALSAAARWAPGALLIEIIRDEDGELNEDSDEV